MKQCLSLDFVNWFTNVKAIYCSGSSRSSFPLPEECVYIYILKVSK